MSKILRRDHQHKMFSQAKNIKFHEWTFLSQHFLLLGNIYFIRSKQHCTFFSMCKISWSLSEKNIFTGEKLFSQAKLFYFKCNLFFILWAETEKSVFTNKLFFHEQATLWRFFSWAELFFHCANFFILFSISIISCLWATLLVSTSKTWLHQWTFQHNNVRKIF